MKTHLLTIAICLIGFNAISQNNCQIESEYPNIFKLEKHEYKGEVYFSQTVNTLDEESCFSDWVNNNTRYIEYLKTIFSKLNYDEIKSIEDEKKRQKAYIRLLYKDTLFKSVMQEWTQKISAPSDFIPDTLNLDDLLNIAVKFFYVRDINPDGYYLAKLCVGINGLKQTEPQRQPQIEAFCFSTIFNHIQDEENNIYNEFINTVKTLYTLNLGTEKKEKLLRAQGAVYMSMKNNKILRELLLTEYQKKQQYLPFVLIEKEI